VCSIGTGLPFRPDDRGLAHEITDRIIGATAAAVFRRNISFARRAAIASARDLDSYRAEAGSPNLLRRPPPELSRPRLSARANAPASSACNSPRGEIHSAGSARYAGNTMEGTVTARVPGPNGQPVDAPGHIAGRYLAPCDAK